MSATKTSISSRLHNRRGLSAAEAALYVGLGVTKFEALVKERRMPRPRVIDRRRLWDVDDLDAAFKAFPYEGDKSVRNNPWDELLKEQDV